MNPKDFEKVATSEVLDRERSLSERVLGDMAEDEREEWERTLVLAYS